MADAERARQMVDALERSDASAAGKLFSERVRQYLSAGWSVEDHIRTRWAPGLDDLAGSPRRIVDAEDVSSSAIRFAIEGPRGHAFVTISFDPDGGVGGLGLERDVFEGIGNLVINTPDDFRTELPSFYRSLFGEDRWRIPRLVFDEGLDHRPAWGDAERPQQLHIEAEVGDLDAADDVVVGNGGTLVEDAPDRRTYGDPVGHAITLIGSDDRSGATAVLVRIVIDCPEPTELAPFYEELLRMPMRVEETAERVVIASDDRRPELAFRRVEPYIAPRWPDPAFPAQMHFDLKVYDRDRTTALAERLGAARLPRGGSCPVYADPVGHPFCLCMHGQ